MDWSTALLSVINFGSYSSVWYWIVVAVVWSSASHYALGVPFDLVQRARRQGGEALADLEALLAINVRRYLFVADSSGPWLVGFVCFFHVSLLLLAFAYRVQMAEAIALIALPMTLVGGLTLRAARRVAGERPQGEAMFRILARLRFWTQVIGMVSIFVTASVGTYQNLYVPNFGPTDF